MRRAAGLASGCEKMSVPSPVTKCSRPDTSPITTQDAVEFQAAHSAACPSSRDTEVVRRVAVASLSACGKVWRGRGQAL